MANNESAKTNLNNKRTSVSTSQNAVITISIEDILAVLWQKKWFLLLFILLGAGVGISIGKWIRPEYTSDALLQVNTKGSKSGIAMGEMGALLDVASPADAEIELIKSRMILENVVNSEHLCFTATPTSMLDRFMGREGRMDLEYLHIPDAARTENFTAVALANDSYEIFAPEKRSLAVGKVGDVVSAPYAGDSLRILVGLMIATPGQEFVLGESSSLNASRGLGRAISVSEKAKQTGVISISYSNRYPDRAAKILNSIADTYVRQNVEMRSAEAEKSLEFLESQLPSVKQKLDSSEALLANYRHKIGSVDMSGETQAHLEKEMNLQNQLLQLEQQRQEATRLFKEEHPSVRTIVKQQDKLRSELASLKKKAETMPLTQQEVLRLQEDVQVNNAIYMTMLNNIQQLRVVRAGEVGNVRIVDRARIETLPSRPQKFQILMCSVAIFFAIGVFLFLMQKVLRNGVRSSSEIERATETSVLAKIPESKSKAFKSRHLHKGLPFVLENPEDVLTESFNSLYTALNFSVNL